MVLLLLFTVSLLFNFATSCPIAEPVCPNKDISFYFYTRSTQNSPYKIQADNNASIQNTPIIPNAPLVLTIHGFLGNATESPPSTALRPAFYSIGEYNIISLDYGVLARFPCYAQAVLSHDTVGNCTAQLLTNLYAAHSTLSPDNTHVIGFSLGAHVAGATGKYLQNLSWITGLDPALPLFSDLNPPSSYLGPEDAKFVDVIHTDAGEIGKVLPSGHVDFYFNNGNQQPGCGININCSHFRALEFYSEAVMGQSPGFWAQPCNLKVSEYLLGISALCVPSSNNYTQIMGPSVFKSKFGTYQIYTNYRSPYARGKK